MAEENEREQKSDTQDGAEREGEALARPEPDRVKPGMPDWLRFPLVLAVVCAVSAVGLAGMYALTRENIEKSGKRKITGAFAEILGRSYSEEKTEEIELDEEGALIKRFVVRDAAGKVRARAGLVKCPGSYNASEPIQLVVVLSADLDRILGVRVARSAETPGLGERVKEIPSARSIFGAIAGRPARERVVMKGSGAAVGRLEWRDDGSVVFTGPGGERCEFEEGEVEVTQAPFPPAFLDQFTGIPVASARLSPHGGAVDAITGATVSSRAVVTGVELAVEELRAAAK